MLQDKPEACAEAEDLLRRLADPACRIIDARRAALVVAHPDDETIAMGAQLARLAGLSIIHVTDGAPSDMRDARAQGFESRHAYAAARRRELSDAMAEGSTADVRLFGLNLMDQRASRSLAALGRCLAKIIAAGDISAIFTHAYEGGHPDHDATAFAVHAARRLVARSGTAAPLIIEVPLYHACGGEMVRQRFAEGAESYEQEIVRPLAAGDLARKRRMLSCFRTQARILADFRAAEERFRRAPDYDFRELPNAGRLFYARFDWGLTPQEWMKLCADAVDELDLSHKAEPVR